MVIIGPAGDPKEISGQAAAKDHFAGDGAEGHIVACAMALKQKARLAIEERNLNHRQSADAYDAEAEVKKR